MLLHRRCLPLLRPFCLVAILFSLIAARPPSAAAITVVNFAPGVEASSSGLNSAQIAGLQNANFNTLVLFSITIDSYGTFWYGGGGGPNIELCTNGVYVGPASWGSQLSQCEASPSSINRIEMCIGGWLDQSFVNIKALIAANGTGSSTVLYQNLAALKNALGLTAMDYDDEYEYDSSSAIQFGQMCAANGMKVTLCPYTNHGYWQQVVSGLGSTVDFVYLQCYSGGQGNDAATWKSYLGSSVTILPGDWDANGTLQFLDQMQTGYRENCAGGWYWPNAANGTVSTGTLKQYMQLIHMAFGPNFYWQGGTANFDADANWVGGIVPGIGTNAINDSGSNNLLEINAGWSVNNLWAGDAPNAKGSIVQNSGIVNVGNAGGWFRLGDSSGAVGFLTMNAGTLNVSNNLDVGELGSGFMTINGGAINLPSSSGLFDVSDSGATGAVTQSNGTVNCSAQLWVGENGGNGTYHLNGGTLTVNNYVVIGRNGGNGTLIMTNGTFTQEATGEFLVGSDGGGGSPGYGTVQQSGGTLHVAEQLLIPEQNASSTGTYNLSGTGSLVVDSWLAIGRGGTGILNMSGGSLTKTAVQGGALDLGAGGAQVGGAGTLNQSGGLISNTSEPTWLGELGNATWNLNGGTDTLGQVVMCIDNEGLTATLNLNGGLFQTTGITNETPAGDTANLYLNGGTLRAGASTATFIWKLNHAYVSAGGAVIDSQSYLVTIPQSLVSNGGGLTKLGAGTLILSGTNTYTGNTVISNGIVTLSGSGSISNTPLIRVMLGTTLNASGRTDGTLTLNSGQTLKGSGAVAGKLVTLPGSILIPGDTIGSLTVRANTTLAGQLILYLNRTNSQNGDELVVNGILTGGGTLAVTNLGPTLQVGDTFQLFNEAASGFTTILLPSVAPYTWANNLATSGSIQVVPLSLAPTSVTAQVSGSGLALAWPSDHTGWQLQCQTNSLLGTNWVTVPNSTLTNQLMIPMNTQNSNAFFRLVYP